MWGTRRRLGIVQAAVRFTPTHVGNTDTLPSAILMYSVHPHACGEHSAVILCILLRIGSPPRMWGTPLAPPEACRACRFTPTHVGNTDSLGGLRPPQTVHPHACGEHAPLCFVPRFAFGSPPRMWGTLVPFGHSGVQERFTPTHVGNTMCDALISV